MTKTRQSRSRLITCQIQKRWPWGCLLFFCIWIGCRSNPQPPIQTATSINQIKGLDSIVQSGDLIVRNGTDDISRAARRMNRIDTSFSHCGIILIERDTPFVYHALGGHYNPSARLRRDPLDSFYANPEIDRVGIFRYDLSYAEHDSLSKLVRRYYNSGLRFDLYFNFLDDDKMYCSEFVFKCLDRSLRNDFGRRIQPREWPYGVSPDDLFLHPRSRPVKRYELK
jgi:hypothetical protein